MTNNDILRRIRYALSLSDKEVSSLFAKHPTLGISLSVNDCRNYMLKPEEKDALALSDRQLNAFLDGLIVDRRGYRQPAGDDAKLDQPKQAAELRLSRNEILKKLRIALSFRDSEMLEIIAKDGVRLSKSELGAFFRAPHHKHYRKVGAQVLRAFLNGLTQTLRSTN